MRKLALSLSMAIVVALAPAGAALARTPAHASIIGGFTAGPGTWPSAAFIVAQNEKEGFACSGTVVAPRVVLTAAHCLTDPTLSDYTVVTGAQDWADEAHRQLSAVVQKATFPGWNEASFFGDAGVLILETPTTAPAMPMATFDDVGLLRGKRNTAVAGWGQTFSDDKNPPSALRTGTPLLQSPSYCGHSAARLRFAFQAPGEICAVDSRDFNSGVCHGDSGGPLVARRADGSTVQIGITSAGQLRCNVHFPGLFTRVDFVGYWAKAWIDSAASSQGGSGPVPTPTTIPGPGKATPPLGQLTNGEVAGDLRQAIAAKMGSRFSPATHYKSRCARQSASAVQCKVSWAKQGAKYSGTVKLFLHYDRAQRLVVVASKAKFKTKHA